MLEEKLKAVVRDILDFPQPGVVFKDITPILKDATLCSEITDAFVEYVKSLEVQVIAGIESRAFLFGMKLANKLGSAYVPIRKQGKLPPHTIAEYYKLEYGQAPIDITQDAFFPETKFLIHDDLLA